jgi:PAS domain S-box-containing protein
MKAPLPANEIERLAALRRYEILDTDAEQDFDDITLLASHICGTPIALISLVDQDRQWFKSRVGMVESETSRDIAFCAYGILQPDVFEVADALADERFANNPLVTGKSKIRFYAGAPLVTPDGQSLGMLCVKDQVPRTLSAAQKSALQVLSRQVVAQLELRRNMAELRATVDQLQSAHAELKEKTAFLEAQINSTIDGVLVLDAQGKKILQSQRMNDLLEIPTHLAADPDGEKQLQWVMDRAKNPGQFIEKVVFLNAHPEMSGHDEIELKKGTILDRHSSPVIGKDGKCLGRIWTFRDITERKHAEEARQKEQEFLAAVFENVTDGIVSCNAEGVLTLFNRVTRELHGLPSVPIPAEQWAQHFDLYLPDGKTRMQREQIPLFRALHENSVRDVEMVIAPKGGLARRFLATGRAFWDANGVKAGAVVAMRDITERKLAEAKLESAQKELIDTSRRAGMAEIATNVLHNVGNVLNSVNVASSCLAGKLRNSKSANLSKVVVMLNQHQEDLGAFLNHDPKGRQLPGYLAQLAEHLAGEQTAALKELTELQKNIEHIKDIVNMQQGFAKVSGLTETFQIADLVEDALKMNASSFVRHDIQIVKEFAILPPVTVEKHKVLQILVNLVRNAKQACDEAEPPEKQLTLRVAGTNDRVRVTVTDNGIGIPPENLNRIFAHGFTTKKTGHGFGLHGGALAAKEMGGSLTVHSDGTGRGAAFTLELPCTTTRDSHE